MQKKILKNFTEVFLMVGIVFFLSAYSPVKNTKTGNGLFEVKTEKKNAGEDLEILRKRIVDDLLQPKVNEEELAKLISTIKTDGNWPGINYIDTSRTGFQHSIHLENMLDLARAYKKNGSRYFMNADVKKTLSSALDYWIANDFISENWWWNEMGTPNWMINTMLVLDTDLTERQRTEGIRIASRASLTGFGARAGGDFVPIAGMVCKQALFKRDEPMLENAIKVMTDQIKLTTGRGINPDMGFHHRVDNVTSIHTYGTNYVSSFAYWTVKTAGTKFTLPDEALRLLIDYYVDGISKAMAFSTYPDVGAKNRDLSRPGTLNPASTEIPENLMLSSNYRKKDLENIVKIRKGEKKSDITWNRFYWWSEYFAHQRKAYFASVRMYSSRQNNMEEPYNEEGLTMHHVADGSNFITRTGKEYGGIFPVWDWQKIPGTTVVQKPALPHWKQIAKKGLTQFVGAVSDGEFGAAAFDFKSVHDPLTARKSWFFFDREYVCLGTGIKSESEYAVATTLNQCLLNKDVVVKTKNRQETLKRGKHSLKDVSWVVHDSIGYFFQTPTSLNLSNTTATGNWRQITHQAKATNEPVNKDVFTLWLDHGAKPTAASYSYIVVPAVTASSLDQYSKKSNIVILANSMEIQAVHNKDLNIFQVVFYKPGTIKLNPNISITIINPCMVMVKMNGNVMERISVSDPTRKLKSLQLSVNAPINAKGDGWQSMWHKEKKSSIINIDLPTEELAGKSVVLQLGSKK